MIFKANKSCQPRDFKVGSYVSLDTRLTESKSANLKSRNFQQPFCRTFCITEAIGADAFRLHNPAHCKMPKVFNSSWLKPGYENYGHEHPAAPLMRTMTQKKPEYEVNAILQCQFSSAKTLQYGVNVVRNPAADRELFANSTSDS